jgi:hypothetical protein
MLQGEAHFLGECIIVDPLTDAARPLKSKGESFLIRNTSVVRLLLMLLWSLTVGVGSSCSFPEQERRCIFFSVLMRTLPRDQ